MTGINASLLGVNDWVAEQTTCSVLNHNMVVFSQQLPTILWIIVGMTFFMFVIYTYLLWKFVELKKELKKAKEVVSNGRTE